jgi:hypothetical protein
MAPEEDDEDDEVQTETPAPRPLPAGIDLDIEDATEVHTVMAPPARSPALSPIFLPGNLDSDPDTATVLIDRSNLKDET